MQRRRAVYLRGFDIGMRRNTRERRIVVAILRGLDQRQPGFGGGRGEAWPWVGHESRDEHAAENAGTNHETSSNRSVLSPKVSIWLPNIPATPSQTFAMDDHSGAMT